MLAIDVSAQAVLSPDAVAQEVIRQQERERVLRQQQEQVPDVRLQRSQAPNDLGKLPVQEVPCFNINRILLIGDAAEKFQWALTSVHYMSDGTSDTPIGRCLGTQGINGVMKRVQNALVTAGFVTSRVLAAPQDLGSGTLELTLIPGRVGAVRFVDEADARATYWNAMPVRAGELLNLRDVEQALENFKRIPTVDADIQIVPAEGQDAKPGESDLVINWKQGLPFRFNLSVDDAGNKSTGKYQGGATISYDHWWTLNDLFYASFNHDLGGGDPGQRGTKGYTVHYSVPLDYWLLAFTSSSNRYIQAVAGASQTYLYRGQSANNEARLSRVIYRDAVRKTTFSTSGWSRSAKNYIDDTEVEVQRRRTAGWDIGLTHREFVGSGTLDMNLNYRRGTGAQGALPAPEEAFGEGTSRARIVTAGTQLNVPFTAGLKRLRYTGAWRAQWNRTPLVPQDRFSIGGRYTVRGFDGENVLSAERGWLVRNDLGWTLSDSGQEIYLGADYGEVGGRSSARLIGTHLSGAVLGMRGGYRSVSYDVFVGQPLTKPEGFRTPSGVFGFNLSWSF